MRTKILALVLTLAVIAVAVPVTYAFVHRGYSSTYYGTTKNRYDDEAWWNEMQQYMEEHWDEIDEAKEQTKTDEDFEEWWDEMKERMEERWSDADDKGWWDEMKEHMEERWSGLEDDGYRYGRSSGYGGFGRCGGWRW